MSISETISKALCVALVITVLLSCCNGIAETEEEIIKGRTQTYNKIVNIDGRNYVLYAQNSPEYSDIYVGDNYSATVGGSTCACFTLANILVNMLGYVELPDIRNMSRFPIRIDSHNILREHGVRERDSFEIKSKEDYFRYFPLCIINVVASNNKGLGKRFATAGYFKNFFENYQLEYEITKDLDYCLEKVTDKDTMVGITTGGTDSPIANKNGHYFVLAYADEEKAYFLDSKFTEEYKGDRKNIIHIIEPGVFYVNLEDIDELHINGSKYIVKAKKYHTQYTQEIYDGIIGRSNKNIKEAKKE